MVFAHLLYPGYKTLPPFFTMVANMAVQNMFTEIGGRLTHLRMGFWGLFVHTRQNIWVLRDEATSGLARGGVMQSSSWSQIQDWMKNVQRYSQLKSEIPPPLPPLWALLDVARRFETRCWWWGTSVPLLNLIWFALPTGLIASFFRRYKIIRTSPHPLFFFFFFFFCSVAIHSWKTYM